MKVGYAMKIGGWSVDSSQDSKTEVLRIDVRRSLDAAGEHGRLVLYAPPKPKPGLLEQAAGEALSAVGLGGAAAGAPAFSVDVRGQKIAHGDPITVSLTAGDVSGTVLTATVQNISSSLETTVIDGQTGVRKLAATRVNRTYQNRTLQQIAQDLASAAGVQTGTLDNGATYPYIVVHDGSSVLSQLRDLARREGADVWFDEEDKLTIQKFTRTKADHELHYGIDVLALQILSRRQPADLVKVSGESPSSNQGADAWHWIAKDISPFRGESGKGTPVATRRDATLRTKDAASNAASAALGEIKDRARLGRVRVLGNPKVHPGQAVEIKDAPQPELNGLFKVLGTRHVFDKREGFTTTISFSGAGGSKQAGGGLLGQLAGAVGL
jgi:hypothetical protein